MPIAVFLLIALLIALGTACLKYLPRGRKVRGLDPRCAACGYIVHGLPAPTCPECGSNLAKPHAIVTPGRLPPGRLARSIAWSAFCFFAILTPAATLWFTFVAPRFPRLRTYSDAVLLERPTSAAYRSIEVAAHSRFTAYPNDPEPPPDHLEIDLTRSDGTTRSLTIDPATLHFRDKSLTRSISPTPLDAASLVAWLRSAGVQGEPTQLNNEMSNVMTDLHEAITRPKIRQMGDKHSAPPAFPEAAQPPHSLG